MIKHNSPFLLKSYLKDVNKTIISNQVANGAKVKKVEKFFERSYYKSGYACLTSSGTSALYLALKSLYPNKTVNVLVPTYSCSAILNAIFLSGNNPVISDISYDTLNYNFKKNFEKIDVVIAVNIYGSDPDINKIKKNYPNSKIILDACHSIGKKILKNDISNKVDLVIHSFYATKIITSGHGGLIWSKNKNRINYCKDYINFDNKKKYSKRFNFLMTDFQAALLLPQLKIMTKIRNYRNDLYKSYRKSVPKNIEIFSLFNLKNNIVYRSILKFKNRHKRDLFKKYMLKNKIECKIPLKNFELLHNYLLKDKKKYSNSELICNTTISLPMHLGLNSQKIKYICKKIKSYK